jgi:hypothetical protein
MAGLSAAVLVGGLLIAPQGPIYARREDGLRPEFLGGGTRQILRRHHVLQQNSSRSCQRALVLAFVKQPYLFDGDAFLRAAQWRIVQPFYRFPLCRFGFVLSQVR